MWQVGLCVVAVVTILISQWLYKWRNPKSNGVLPPGSMGLPFIGETLQLLIPNHSLDLHPFIKKRIEKYGRVFSTNLVGRPMVITADPKLNNYLFQQEGKEVELWYLDTFEKVFRLEGEARPNAVGRIHKYLRGTFLTLFGVDSLRTKLLSEIETTVRTNIHRWSTQGTIDAKKEAANDKDKLEKVIRAMLKERIACPEEKKGDFLDRAVKDLNTDFFLTENFILSIIVGALFATVESISTAIALSFKLFAEHPWVVEDLVAEHDILLKNRENKESPLTWDEYKSMTVTMHVINEVLRLGNVAPGILRKTLKDINYNGYTIPAGWAIMMVNCTLQLNPNVFKDPLAFNPRRWKDIDPQTASKNFMPFGGGIRQCAGAEFSKAFFATFLHVLVSEYKWTKIKGGDVARTPMLQFQDGMYIKVSKKHA
ncbi:cytochrome P450 87A3-like isoform X2 [Camellia sinensis]|uniref:cytochrome P450 87A3-like isoform X2 n=1 Tax=Camellia sinensis TaxID=4442 RepID=UPI001035F20B|nr:cytochrome P450 87A3-like isoform X2 [Camellia sinensis]